MCVRLCVCKCGVQVDMCRWDVNIHDCVCTCMMHVYDACAGVLSFMYVCIHVCLQVGCSYMVAPEMSTEVLSLRLCPLFPLHHLGACGAFVLSVPVSWT